MDAQCPTSASGMLANRMSRRAAFRRVGGGGLSVGLPTALGREIAAGAQETTPTDEGLAPVSVANLYDQVATPMVATAERARLAIDAGTIAFAANGNNLVVTAPTMRSAPGFAQPGPMALAYFSLSSIACGRLTSGYYTLELVRDNELAPLDQVYPGAYEVAVHVVNLDGEVVAERPFTREVMRMRGPEAAAAVPSPPVQVFFQESRALMGAIDVIVHSSDHYHYACYEIWEWTYGGM